MSEIETRASPLRLISLPRWKPVRRDPNNQQVAATTMTNETSMQSNAAATGASTAVASKVVLKPASDVLAGAFARAASQSAIHPLDTLKVRLQTMKAPKAGLPNVPMKLDIRAACVNVASLYRGIVGAASGAGIAIGAYFAFYGVACNVLSLHTELKPGAIAFVAGGVAALGSSVVKVPLAVCIRSVQAGVYPNVFNAASTITKAAGPRGLFTGYLPTVLEDVPDMAIKFAAYESLRNVYLQVQGRMPSTQEDFMFGAFSGALAAAATTPLDVIKTNMMCSAASRPSMSSAAAVVYSQGGVKAFFRGIGTRALSNGINSAVFFCFFEAIRSSFSTYNNSKVQLEVTMLEVAE